MKTKTIISILIFLSIAFLWSCEKEFLTTNDQEIVLQKAKPEKPDKPGKPGNNDDEDAIYEVKFNGSINSTKTYGSEVTNNKKFDLMHTDACGYFLISGINDLVNCANISNLNFCVDGIALRQFDKKIDPGHVSFSLWVLDGINGNHNFRMFGWLQGDATTLFPESMTTVHINFDNWISSGPDGCPDAEGEFGTEKPSVTITKIDSGCPGNDTCMN